MKARKTAPNHAAVAKHFSQAPRRRFPTPLIAGSRKKHINRPESMIVAETMGTLER